MPATFMASPERPYGPWSPMPWMSRAVMRPSARIPSRMRAWTPGRPRPIMFSSRRVMRIMTGLPIFFDSRMGICACT